VYSPVTVDLDREAAGRYVLSRLTPEGGYSFYRTPQWGVEEPNAPDTLAALESLRILGIVAPRPASTGAWLRALQAEDGGYPTLTIGWAALRSLALLGIEPVHPFAKWLSGREHALLGERLVRDWRGALRDALRLVELSHLSEPAPGRTRRGVFSGLLDEARDPFGGWASPGADLETTGVAVLIGGPKDLSGHDRVDAGDFLRRCEDGVLGLRLRPDAGATSVGALWGGLELAGHLGLALTHPGAVAESLALMQRVDGGLGARHAAISTLQDTWRGLEAARLLDQLQEAAP